MHDGGCTLKSALRDTLRGALGGTPRGAVRGALRGGFRGPLEGTLRGASRDLVLLSPLPNPPLSRKTQSEAKKSRKESRAQNSKRQSQRRPKKSDRKSDFRVPGLRETFSTLFQADHGMSMKIGEERNIWLINREYGIRTPTCTPQNLTVYQRWGNSKITSNDERGDGPKNQGTCGARLSPRRIGVAQKLNGISLLKRWNRSSNKVPPTTYREKQQ